MTNTEGVKPVEVDPWERIGFLEGKLEQVEAERDEWKERAMSERLHRLTHQPDTAAQPVACDDLFETAKHLNSWLGSVADCDLDEVVADGGVTAAMVIRQEAGEQQRRIRAAIGREIATRQALAKPASQPVTDLIERTAQWLHDEGGFDEAWSGATWPEHPDDTGQRDGGYVRLVPADVQAKFRDVARRLLAGRDFAHPPAQPVGDVERLADQWAWERWPSSHDYVERDAAREGYVAALSQHSDPQPQAERTVSPEAFGRACEIVGIQPQADVVERQKIVAWLRGIGAPEPFMGGIGEARPLTTATAIADAIEQGKHGEMG